MGKDNALVDVGGGYRFVGVFEVFVQQTFLYFECNFECFKGVFVLPVLLVDAAEVVEAECSQL